MKTRTNLIVSFCLFIQFVFAGESKLYPILGPASITCCNNASYSIDVENINPSFAIANIAGIFTVRRDNGIIHEETIIPRFPDLSPGDIATFTTQIPMEVLQVDGSIYIDFEFTSDFDLNQDPAAYYEALVAGCGLTEEEIEDLLRLEFDTTDAGQARYLFLKRKLVKPGTIISGSNGETWTRTVSDFSWIGMKYSPSTMFEQPVELYLINAITEQIDNWQTNWYPLVDGTPFYPAADDGTRITGGIIPPPGPPPLPLTNEVFPSEDADSVCAILVYGSDGKNAKADAAFYNSVEQMKMVLNSINYGPLLPESNILVKEGANYTRDSLIRDIRALENKYNKLYFYYAGHGSDAGHMCIGADQSEWITYEDFVNELLATGTKKFCLFIDACYSGKLIDVVNANPLSVTRDFDISTASETNKEAKFVDYDFGTVIKHYTKYSLHVYWAMQMMEVDKNGDGKISFKEANEYVRLINRDKITVEQDPQHYRALHYSMMKWGELMIDAAEAEIIDFDPDNTTIRIFPDGFPAGTEIVSFDQQTQFTVPVHSVFGWIETSPNALFGKPVYYSIIYPSTNEVQLLSGIEFWPTMPAVPGFNAFDHASVYRANLTFTLSPQIQTISADNVPVSFDEPNVALLVGGYHADPITAGAIVSSVYTMYNELVAEDNVRHSVYPDNARLLNGATKQDIHNLLNSLPVGGKSLLFYYAGNTTIDGEFASSPNAGDWFDLQDLLQKIYSLNPATVTFMFDAPLDPSFLNVLNGANEFTNYTVLSSGIGPTGNTIIYVDDNANFLGSNLAFTTSTAESHNADHPDLKRTITEKFYWNVGTPVVYYKQEINASSDLPSDNPLPGADMDIRMEVRNADIGITVEQSIIERIESNWTSEVFEVAPIRQWKVTSDSSLNPGIRMDVVFHLDSVLDAMSSLEGILGVVTRASSDQAWIAHYPSTHNLVDNTIIASNADFNTEWAIAMISEPVSTSDKIEGLSGLTIFPNPVINDLIYSFNIDYPKTLAFSVLDANGCEVHRSDKTMFEAGEWTSNLKVDHLYSGIYFLKVEGDHDVYTKGFMLMD